jgi:bacterioferritin
VPAHVAPERLRVSASQSKIDVSFINFAFGSGFRHIGDPQCVCPAARGESEMQGNPEIIEALNEVLTSELTAINQYFIHYKMCENWGLDRLAKKKRGESIEEMKHADEIIERILFFDGTPNMQRLSPVRVGEDPIEQHRLDLALELDAVERLNRAIPKARDAGDNGTRELFEAILKDEEESVDWHEAQLYLVENVGKEAYLAEQINE